LLISLVKISGFGKTKGFIKNPAFLPVAKKVFERVEIPFFSELF